MYHRDHDIDDDRPAKRHSIHRDLKRDIQRQLDQDCSLEESAVEYPVPERDVTHLARSILT